MWIQLQENGDLPCAIQLEKALVLQIRENNKDIENPYYEINTTVATLGGYVHYGKAKEVFDDILKKIELGRHTYIMPPDEE